MSALEDAGARLARLAQERRVYEDAIVRQHQQRLDLAAAKRDANLQYILGLLNRLVAGFNRSAAAELEVILKVEDASVYILRNYTTLLVVGFEEGAVTVHSAPRAKPAIDKRLLFEPGADGSIHLVDAERPDAVPGSVERFAEGVLMLALGLYP